MAKKKPSAMNSVETIREIILDMREGDKTRGNRDFNLNRLEKETDTLEQLLVTGHGTGSD